MSTPSGSDRERLLEDALLLACDVAEQHGADPRELVTLRECAADSHPVSRAPHDAPRRTRAEPYNMAGYGPGPTGTRRAVPEDMHDNDPRGPLVRVTHVDGSGSGPVILTLSCGHRVERVNHFSYHVGEESRCFACRKGEL